MSVDLGTRTRLVPNDAADLIRRRTEVPRGLTPPDRWVAVALRIDAVAYMVDARAIGMQLRKGIVDANGHG